VSNETFGVYPGVNGGDITDCCGEVGMRVDCGVISPRPRPGRGEEKTEEAAEVEGVVVLVMNGTGRDIGEDSGLLAKGTAPMKGLDEDEAMRGVSGKLT
jgi:hypothetical protein